jgi:hypothetical protein
MLKAGNPGFEGEEALEERGAVVVAAESEGGKTGDVGFEMAMVHEEGERRWEKEESRKSVMDDDWKQGET